MAHKKHSYLVTVELNEDGEGFASLTRMNQEYLGFIEVTVTKDAMSNYGELGASILDACRDKREESQPS